MDSIFIVVVVVIVKFEIRVDDGKTSAIYPITEIYIFVLWTVEP